MAHMSLRLKGTIEECLKHFSERHKLAIAGRAVWKKRNDICELLGVNPQTGHRWFAQIQGLPSGLNEWKLMHFLKLDGYDPKEPWPVAGVSAELNEQVVLGVASLEDIANELCTTPAVVSAIILRGTSTSEEKFAGMRKIVARNRNAATRALAEWKRFIAELEQTVDSAKPAAQAEPAPVATIASGFESDGGPLSKDGVVAALASLINAAMPLAKLMLSDDFGPEDRERLRKLTETRTSHNVFELSNVLNGLCGEKARRGMKS